jgi:nucleotide-binding universal stress UspA family protein
MGSAKILVAHDLSATASRALRFALGLARQMGASVEVVHVHPDVYDGRSMPAVGLPWPTAGQEERYMRFLDEELARAVEETSGKEAREQVGRRVVRGIPEKRLIELATEQAADILCVGATGKGAVDRVLLGSVSQLLIRTCPVPVLIIP